MSSIISKKDMERIRNLDLYSYCLNYEPELLVPDGKKDFRIRSNHSVVVSNGKWHEMSKKGNPKKAGGKSALDYFVYIENKDFLPEAKRILDLINGKEPVVKKFEPKTKEFHLPNRNSDNRRLYGYLVGKRKIDRAVVDYCINHDLIYEDEKHNVVFVGYDMDQHAKYAFKRSTWSDGKFDVEGSKKEFGFKLGDSEATTVNVFESAIDALSYISLIRTKDKNWEKNLYIALGGVGGEVPPALKLALMWGNIKTVYLHLDNDEAGKNAAASIMDALKDKYTVFDMHPKYCKDINEVLIKTKRNRQER